MRTLIKFRRPFRCACVCDKESPVNDIQALTSMNLTKLQLKIVNAVLRKMVPKSVALSPNPSLFHHIVRHTIHLDFDWNQLRWRST